MVLLTGLMRHLWGGCHGAQRVSVSNKGVHAYQALQGLS